MSIVDRFKASGLELEGVGVDRALRQLVLLVHELSRAMVIAGGFVEVSAETHGRHSQRSLAAN